MKRTFSTFGLLVVVLLALHWIVQAGNLETSSSPSVTTNTLDEPRVPILASDLPLTISQPGSYYLAENITSATGDGITVSASDVTIDLMGFALSALGGIGTGILSTAGTFNVEVRNGTISEWDTGLDLRETTGARVVQLRASFNDVGGGIHVGTNGAVIQTLALHNEGVGIEAGDRSGIAACIARGNETIGIRAGVGSVVTDSVAADNASDGISVGAGSRVIGCASESNKTGDGITADENSAVLDSSARFNDGNGITMRAGGTVRGCTVSNNLTNGISATSALVEGNNCQLNDILAGIQISGSGSRVDGNHVIGNATGIQVDAAGNVIMRNSASANTTNYDIVAGNDVGPIGSAARATRPWSNLQL